MKKIILLLFACVFIYSCKEEASAKKEAPVTKEKNIPQLVYSNHSLSEKDLEPCKNSTCPSVKIDFLRLEGNPMASQINGENEQHLIQIFNSTPDSITAKNLEEAATGFVEDYFSFRDEFSESPAEYDAEISQKIISETDSILVVETQFYLFTGGAHGYGATRFQNYHLKTGKKLSRDYFIKNIDEFTQFVEHKFREKYNIPQGESINSEGFFFENDQFSLPENIAFKEDEIILIYNRYEAASYAEGELKFTFKKEELKNLINY